jgi:O-methyltransferase/aklanonic acid methyltransferase
VAACLAVIPQQGEEIAMRDDEQTRKAQRAALFNRLAADYDAGVGAFAHFGRRLVALAGIEPGQRVLDVATGRGAVLFPAAERVGAAGEVVGIDLAGGMVQATNEEAARRGLAARARVMDAERLDFPDGAFDRVLCGFGIMFFPHLDRTLDEFRRVLKPGGRLGVSTWRVDQCHDLSAVLRELGLGGEPEPGWITEPDALVRPLEQAGFSDLRVVADSKTFCYVDLEQYWQTVRGTGTRRLLDALDAVQTERVRAALAERLRAQQLPDGIHVVTTALLATASR